MGDRARAAHVEAPVVLRLYLGPDFESVRVVLARIASELERYGIKSDRIGGAELVLAEVLNNIVEHAFEGRSDGRIEVTLAPADDCVRCDVRDNGCAMPGGRLPFGARVTPGQPLAEIPEGGFGWFLIRSLVEDLSYTRDGQENFLRFSIPFDSEPMAS